MASNKKKILSLGDRLRFLRHRRGLTQKQLGSMAGFTDTHSDVRVAQYESGHRVPSDVNLQALSDVLGVAPAALKISECEDLTALMHTLFALEDLYGLRVSVHNDVVSIWWDSSARKYAFLRELERWESLRLKYKAGEVSEEEYNAWRYHYLEGR